MGTVVPDERGVMTPCPSCGKMNRIAYRSLGKAARCGQCSTALTNPAGPIDIPSADVFETLTRESALPVVVDFWAPWCGPCRMVAPELEKVARQAAGEFLVVKVNTDAVPELGERFRVRSIPTMAVFHEGREVTRTAGARPASDILEFVRRAAGTVAR